MMVMVMMVMSQGCKVQRSNEEFSKRSNEEFYKRTRRNVLGEELYKCVRTITNRIIIVILIMLLTLETVDHCGVCVGLLDTGLVIWDRWYSKHPCWFFSARTLYQWTRVTSNQTTKLIPSYPGPWLRIPPFAGKYGVPGMHLVFGQRSFTVTGPSVWNSRNPHVRDFLTETIFRSKVKTHLFRSTYGSLWLRGFTMHFWTL